MNIKKIRIGSFGKIKNLELKFTEGLNVVYGENEAGKSTMQSFIKAMFYGMNSQKKVIKENDRRRFLPWNGDTAGGELVFEDGSGSEYVIKRTFGITRKEDDSAIFNSITGVNNAYANPMSPGSSIFGIGEEAFEKTLFIRQLGSEVGRDKEDEIMKKLINLGQSGDENTSFYKAVKILEEARKNIKGIRKSGSLDKLQEKYELLINEQREVLSLQEENLSDLNLMGELNCRKEKLKEEVINLEREKENIKELELLHQYQEIKSYRDKIQELRDNAEVVDSFLKKGHSEVTDNYVDNLRKEIHVLEEKRKNLQGKLLKEEALKENIENIEIRLKNYQGYDRLDVGIENKVYNLEHERKQLEAVISQYDIVKSEIARLELELETEKNRLGKLNEFENLSEEKEKIIYNHEERLKELKYELQLQNKSDGGLHIRKASPGFGLQKYLMMAAVLISVISLVCGFLLGPGYYGGLVPAVALIIYCLSRRKNSPKGSSAIYEEIDRINTELDGIYVKYGVKDYEDLVFTLRRYNEAKKHLDILKARIHEKGIQINDIKVEETRTSLARNIKFLKFLFEHCDVSTVEEFLQGLQNYRVYWSRSNSLKEELQILQQNIEVEEESINDIFENLKKELAAYSEGGEDLNLLNIVDSIAEKLKMRNEIGVTMRTMEESLGLMLKGRSLEDFEGSLKGALTAENETSADFLKGFSGMHLNHEEGINILIKDKNNELMQLEKRIKDVEIAIKNRFHGRVLPGRVQEEIASTLQKIKEQEQNIKFLDLTVELLREAFEEIQRSFGPKLNKYAGEILQFITAGKYSELRVSQDYEIKVVDTSADRIKELDYFSNGTCDQIYFALRMAIIMLIFDNKAGVPVIFDETFVQYDDVRLKRVLEYLYEYSKSNQVILFTCQKRELNILSSDYKDVNYIDCT